MNGAALRKLVRLSLSRERRATTSSVFGVGVGIASLVFFVALGLGVGHVVREKVFPVDASLVEVNPLIVTGDGRLVALDAKIGIDPNALFRHPDLAAQRDVTQAKVRREIDHPHARLQQSRRGIERNTVGRSEEHDITLLQTGILGRLERKLEMPTQIREQGVDTYARFGSRGDALHL